MKVSVKKLIGNSNYTALRTTLCTFYYVPNYFRYDLLIKIDHSDNTAICVLNGRWFEEKDFDKISNLKLLW